MPAFQPADTNRKIHVSGTNGFIGIWVARTLLERGYSVRSTVRADAKAEHLRKVFSEYGDKHEIVIVPDITKEGAFDEAVKGVHAVEHVASPVDLALEDPYELINPAVKGTVGMLQSVLNHGTSIQRIVITSSVAAVIHDDPTPLIFDESDWNEQCLEILARGGPQLTGPMKYRASKTLAEKAAWKFWEDNQTKIKWDIVVINPPYVFGPTIHEAASPSALNVSTVEWYNYVVRPTSSGATNEFLATTGSGGWVDVRDLAEAHVQSLEREAAGSKRIIVSVGAWKWQDFVDEANTISPPPKLSRPLPVGNPRSESANPATVHMLQYNTDRAKTVFEIQYRTISETTRDMLVDFESKGWL
ncbi:hypothetical protein BJ138DRAFT_1016362 [Hygrophoropsis aurantiaca]|uniref:Uncharacterized protein n=1 Tax=Hygrophoropsis aurantiaca TaxID=72124 RepID=A0ACB7ZYM5_9AGAM|nr:hypothetical protein BJ138DRAFT_1016362 [Hygrophoropsis aurantiaca]